MATHSKIFSSRKELNTITRILKNYARLPFSSINIPGAVMEGVLGHVRKAEVLRTYDFIDVLSRREAIGWQIKSTLAGTPVTWKRAKIPQSAKLIAGSEKSKKGQQVLGNAIIDYCNRHARESLEKYQLEQIGYARLVVHENGEAQYFERLLCTRDKPDVFDAEDFVWEWSTPKITTKKEQLSALHGRHRTSGKKWFAWHGRGENQLHFSGEHTWWPSAAEANHAITFKLPSDFERVSLEGFIDLLAASDNPLSRV